MTIFNRPIAMLRGSAMLALLLIGALVSTACDSGSPALSAAPTPTVVRGGAAPAGTTTGPPAPARTPAGNTTNSKLNCQALANAAFDLNGSEPFLVTLAGAGGSVVNRVDTPFYVDTAKLRADLDVLATLPDPVNAAEIAIMGKPSETIPQFRQLLDLIDAAAKAATGATPADGSNPQLLGFSSKLVQMSVSINAAVGNSCPNATANGAQIQPPGAAATPRPASYQIGQTAPVGDLRVTLNRVATLAGADALLPAPGNRFVFVYLTVQNTGTTPFQVNTLTGTHWEDAAGKEYFADPYSISLDPNATNFDGAIAPGAEQSGAIGYQLPSAVGDLVWVFQDFKPNRAVFAVKAGEVATLGTPVTEATAAALRAGAAATQTAFVDLALSAAATEAAAGTKTPAPAEPTTIAAPPEPTDPPALPAPEDTPTTSP